MKREKYNTEPYILIAIAAALLGMLVLTHIHIHHWCTVGEDGTFRNEMCSGCLKERWVKIKE